MLWTLFIANVKLIVRNRLALFWALVFPLIFVVAFGLFKFDSPQNFKVAVVDNAQDMISKELITHLGEVELLQLDQSRNEQQARDALDKGDVDFVLIFPNGLALSLIRSDKKPEPIALVYDESQFQTNQVMVGVIERFIGDANLAIAGAGPVLTLAREGMSARSHKYFDFLLPGFIGMGVMTYSIIGIASTMAVYRQQKILKRIKATPLRVRDFFIAKILAYLVLSLVQAAIILAAGVFIFNASVYGNLGYLFLLVLLGNMVFLNLGFIVGSVANTVEAASGLGNVLTMPMMFFSGVFFPTESLPNVLAVSVKYLPLTPMLDAMRGVVLDGNPVWDYPMKLAILGAWIVGTSIVAVKTFRFG